MRHSLPACLSATALAILCLLAAGAGAEENATSSGEQKFYTCFSKYALCISAPCVPTEGTVSFLGQELPQAKCECEVMFGYNIGSTTCEERVDQQTGDKVISTYSVAQTEGKGMLQCEGGKYTDCFNFDCTVDPQNPYRATCYCPILEAKSDENVWITRGGDCRAQACQKLWSAAPESADLAINQLLWKQLGFTENPPTGYHEVPPVNSCGVVGQGSD